MALPNCIEVTDLQSSQRFARIRLKNPASTRWRINTLDWKIAVRDRPHLQCAVLSGNGHGAPMVDTRGPTIDLPPKHI